MTIRHLQSLFNPTSVAVLGASREPGSIGAILARNLAGGGFSGEIYPVGPAADTIEGLPAFPNLESLPKAPDLAVIAAPPETVPELIERLGGMGTKAAVLITGRARQDGRADAGRLHDRMLQAARPHLLRLMGPGSLGIMVPGRGLNAGLGHMQPLKGHLAFVTQSGGIRAAVLDWATSKGIGFSHIVSMGDMIDIDFGDMLDYLATDYSTKAILLYIETVTHVRKFMSAARAAARMKPVVVVKPGRHAETARIISARVGTPVGADAVYTAAFERAGMLRVMDMQALFNAVETLAMSRPFAGDRLAILTNGGGMGVMAADVLMDKRGRLAELSPATVSRLDELLPVTRSHHNPVDLGDNAPPERYAATINAVLEDTGVDALLVICCPTALSSGTGTAIAVAEAVKTSGPKAASRGLFTCWPGLDAAGEARNILTQHRIPAYATPAEAVRGFMQMVRYRTSQKMLMETPASIPEVFAADTATAREIVGTALAQGREWLDATEVKDLLSAYKISIVPGEASSTAHEQVRDLIIGASLDPQFGPVILFGEGGAAVDVIADTAVALPPLNMQLAGELIRKTRVSRLLAGYSGQPAVDPDGIALTLVKVSQIVCDIENIAELTLNPLRADGRGVQVYGARIRVAASSLPAAQRLAIRPYPKELEEVIPLPDGQTLLLRPVRPEDEPAFQALFSTLTMDEIRLRFLHAMQFMSHEMAAFLTQIDYDREMALVLCEPAVHRDAAMYGMVRLMADPDNAQAEFDILLRHDMTGLGLGPMLMRRIIDYAGKRGVGEIFGEVLAENRSMLRLCEAFGFKKRRDPEDPGVMLVSLMLNDRG